MPTLEEVAYDGFFEKAKRLGLEPLLQEARDILSGFDLRVLDELMAITERNIQLQQDALLLVQRRVQGGVASGLDAGVFKGECAQYRILGSKTV